MSLDQEIVSSIRYSLSRSTNDNNHSSIFDSLLDKFEAYYSQPCHNIVELKRRTTKTKGDLWEHFCCMYLKAQDNRFANVWLLQDVPSNIASQLGLAKQDMGIDIVVQETNGQFSAVQAKYRLKSKRQLNKKHSLTWNCLSTFYAYCGRTGPWNKLIVMTNCDYVSRKGMKNDQDWTFARQRFASTPRSMWLSMIGSSGQTLDSTSNNSTTTATKRPKQDELREIHAKRFCRS